MPELQSVDGLWVGSVSYTHLDVYKRQRHASQTTVLRIGGAGMSNKTSGFKRAIGIVLGVITMLVLIALFVVLVMAPIPNIWVDKVTASDNAIDQTVSPTQSETY